jgi:hypothetical protein
MVAGQGFPACLYASTYQNACLSSYIEQFSSLNDLSKDTLGFVHPVTKEKALYAKGAFREMIENFDGDELHIFAAGGGGDLKGAIVLARQMVRMLNERPGKMKVTKVKLFTSNLKRGEENTIGGPAPMDAIFYDKNGVRTPIERVQQYSPFYELADEDYYAVSNIYTEKDLLAFAFNTDKSLAGIRPEKPLSFNGHVFEAQQPLFENDIVDIIKDRKIDDTAMSIVIADCQRSGQELNMYYRTMITGRENKVLTLLNDIGGDIMARFPGQIAGDVTHPEYEVRSPNTDAIFLDMFEELEMDRPMNTIVAISALGGDGELGRTIVNYLAELQTDDSIMGVIDNAYYFSERQEDIDWARAALARIPSEVSTNFINSIERTVAAHHEDILMPIDPNDVRFTYQDEDEPNQPLRGGSRYEFKPRHYLNTIFVSATALKGKVVDLTMKDSSKGWYAADHYLRNKFHYLTEMNDPNNVLARLKQNVIFLKDVLNEKYANGRYVGMADGFMGPFDSVLVKLAGLLALCERSADREGRRMILALLEKRDLEGEMPLPRMQGESLLPAVIIDAFSRAVILTRKPLNAEEIRVLTRLVKHPIGVQDPILRGFDYWAIRDEALKALQMTQEWQGWGSVGKKDVAMKELLAMRTQSLGRSGKGIESLADKIVKKTTAHLNKDQSVILQTMIKRVGKLVGVHEYDALWGQIIMRLYQEIEHELASRSFETNIERCDSRMKVSRLYSLLAKVCEMIMQNDREKKGVLPLDIQANVANKRYHTAADKLIDLLAVSGNRSDVVLRASADCFKMLALRYIKRSAKEYLVPKELAQPRRFVKDMVRVEAPARLGIMRGGEVDYYAIDEAEGAHAVNAAITIGVNGEKPAMPLTVTMKKSPRDNKILFWFQNSRNERPELMICRTRYDVFRSEPEGPTVNDCFNLFKQIIIAMGIVPYKEHRRLSEVLNELGGGLEVTVTSAMPIKSGLGLVSSLALAYVEGLAEMTGVVLNDADKYKICAYALNGIAMTTAWQDIATVGRGGIVDMSMQAYDAMPTIMRSDRPGIEHILRNKLVLMYFGRDPTIPHRKKHDTAYDREMRFILNYYLAHYKKYKANKLKFNALITRLAVIMLKDMPAASFYEVLCGTMREYIELADEVIPYYRMRSEGIQRRFNEALIDSPASPFLDIYKPSGFGTRGGVYVFFLKEDKSKQDAEEYVAKVINKLLRASDLQEDRDWLQKCQMLNFEITDRGTQVISDDQAQIDGAKGSMVAA